MWIQVRTMDGKRTERIQDLSKLTKVKDLRKTVVELFELGDDQIAKFYFAGKQLEDSHTLYDYDITMNCIVQLMIAKLQKAPSEEVSQPIVVKPIESPKSKVDKLSSDTSTCQFKPGDIVDVQIDNLPAAWFEALIEEQLGMDEKSVPHYKVKMDTSENQVKDTLPEFETVAENHIRPRSRTKVSANKMNIGDVVLVNHNIDDPKSRGYWYDGTITQVEPNLVCSLKVSQSSTLEDCIIKFPKEVFAIEAIGSQKNLSDVTKKQKKSLRSKEPEDQLGERRKNKPNCDVCSDEAGVKCRACGCKGLCRGGKERPDLTLMCDDCDDAFHIYCLDPPLECVPDDDQDWYCPSCRTDPSDIVAPGQAVKVSKRKKAMPSGSKSSSRDWGKGMACAGANKKCSIVADNHFGAIPGVEVGTAWKFRIQASESGIHRPVVAGIAGREAEGAFSIVLSGGYEDDEDFGDEFFYTGSGGRDLSGNKRTAEQSCDQVLTRMNKALAKNCAADFSLEGGDAGDKWRDGKAVRVVRNYKASKHSKYAPTEGNRYDGVYKIVKYWPEKGRSGFVVWRYLLRRDDPIPPPWTPEGKARVEMLGLQMQYPEGYLEAQAAKAKDKAEDGVQGDDDSDEAVNDENIDPAPTKKSKWAPDPKIIELIESDSANSKVWSDILAKASTHPQFRAAIEISFECICCRDLVADPVTTPCGHNFCQACLKASFEATSNHNCPFCRAKLDEKVENYKNQPLHEILIALYPGYNVAR